MQDQIPDFPSEQYEFPDLENSEGKFFETMKLLVNRSEYQEVLGDIWNQDFDHLSFHDYIIAVAFRAEENTSFTPNIRALLTLIANGQMDAAVYLYGLDEDSILVNYIKPIFFIDKPLGYKENKLAVQRSQREAFMGYEKAVIGFLSDPLRNFIKLAFNSQFFFDRVHKNIYKQYWESKEGREDISLGNIATYVNSIEKSDVLDGLESILDILMPTQIKTDKYTVAARFFLIKLAIDDRRRSLKLDGIDEEQEF